MKQGWRVVTLIDASLDDWDRYESLHWLAAEEWLAKHADEPDAEGVQILTQRFRGSAFRGAGHCRSLYLSRTRVRDSGAATLSCIAIFTTVAFGTPVRRYWSKSPSTDRC
jgi:hypothetical protein